MLTEDCIEDIAEGYFSKLDLSVYNKSNISIFLGGQPGSGKSSFANCYKDKSFILSVDNLLYLHPQYKKRIKSHNVKIDFDDPMRKDVGKISEVIRSKILDRKISIIEDQAFASNHTSNLIKMHHKKDKKIKVYILVCPAKISFFRALNRFLIDVNNKDSKDKLPRFITKESITETFEKILRRIREIKMQCDYVNFSFLNGYQESLNINTEENLINEHNRNDFTEKEVLEIYHLYDNINKLAENNNDFINDIITGKTIIKERLSICPTL